MVFSIRRFSQVTVALFALVLLTASMQNASATSRPGGMRPEPCKELKQSDGTVIGGVCRQLWYGGGRGFVLNVFYLGYLQKSNPESISVFVRLNDRAGQFHGFELTRNHDFSEVYLDERAGDREMRDLFFWAYDDHGNMNRWDLDIFFVDRHGHRDTDLERNYHVSFEPVR